MEPLLENISAIIPDEKIDRELSFPCPDRGPHPDFKLSQLYRIHLLLSLKRLVSFRQVHKEMKHHRDWRAFAQLKNKNQVPSLDVLSRFRQRASSLLRQINQLYLKMVFDIVGVPESVITVPDSTDIEAATKGYTKKSAVAMGIVIIRDFLQLRKRLKDIALKNLANLNGSSVTKNTRFVFSS
jgi:hypothetical protein